MRHVVADHQQIAVEDFKPKFLTKSTMDRKSADATITATKIELILPVRPRVLQRDDVECESSCGGKLVEVSKV